MERDIKIYRVKLSPSTMQRETSLNISLSQDDKVTKSKRVLLTDKAINVFFEPPTLSKIIRLQTVSDEKISLCEVEAYGTGTFHLSAKVSVWIF